MCTRARWQGVIDIPAIPAYQGSGGHANNYQQDEQDVLGYTACVCNLQVCYLSSLEYLETARLAWRFRAAEHDPTGTRTAEAHLIAFYIDEYIFEAR